MIPKIEQAIVFTEAPDDYTRFDLLTKSGGFVTRCALPFMNPLPEIIGYGDRVFVKTKRKGAPDDPVAQENPDNYVYIEGMAFWPMHFNQKDERGRAGASRFRSGAINPPDEADHPLDPVMLERLDRQPDPEPDTTLGAPVEPKLAE